MIPIAWLCLCSSTRMTLGASFFLIPTFPLAITCKQYDTVTHQEVQLNNIDRRACTTDYLSGEKLLELCIVKSPRFLHTGGSALT